MTQARIGHPAGSAPRLRRVQTPRECHRICQVETQTLRWLVEIADGSTVAAVAARHHISQPAVTRGVGRLSAEVGVPLTELAGRRLRLTFAGERIVDAARRMLAELDGGLRAVAEADDPARGAVRLGFLAPLGTWPVPELITDFRAERPAIHFELSHDGESHILEALRAGALDLLLTEGPAEDTKMRFEALFVQELLLALPADHELAARPRVQVGELAEESSAPYRKSLPVST